MSRSPRSRAAQERPRDSKGRFVSYKSPRKYGNQMIIDEYNSFGNLKKETLVKSPGRTRSPKKVVVDEFNSRGRLEKEVVYKKSPMRWEMDLYEPGHTRKVTVEPSRRFGHWDY